MKFHLPRWPFILRSTHESIVIGLTSRIEAGENVAEELNRKLSEIWADTSCTERSLRIALENVTGKHNAAWARVKELEEKLTVSNDCITAMRVAAQRERAALKAKLAAKAKPVKRGKRKK